MQKTLSGSTEQVLQALADEIGKLSQRITALEDQQLLHRMIFAKVFLPLFVRDGTIDVEAWRACMKSMADGYKAEAEKSSDREISRRMTAIADDCVNYEFDALSVDAPPPTPTFQVIPGGKA